MKIIDKILDHANGQWGEDRYFYNNSFLGVIDGSTPIEKIKYNTYNTQVEWFSEELSKFLNTTDIVDLRQACVKFINNTENLEFIKKLSNQNKPNAVIAAIQISEGNLQLLNLGDCAIEVLYKNDNIIKFSDKRIAKFSNKTKEIRLQAIQMGLNLETEIKKQLSKNKRFMNEKDGYWTIAYKGSFEKEFLIKEIKLNEVEKVLIYSDGFEEIFRLTNITSRNIFQQSIKLQDCINKLREIEKELKNRISVKKHDDATAILVEL